VKYREDNYPIILVEEMIRVREAMEDCPSYRAADSPKLFRIV
jgi:hypothetical protein